MTLEEAKTLRLGTTLHHTLNKNEDGTPQRWRVSGQVQTWKRDSSRVKVPIKHGLYVHDYLTEDSLDLLEFPN